MNWDETKTALKEAQSYAIFGGVAGSVLLSMADYLDSGFNSNQMIKMVGLGFVGGAIVGEGIGLMVNAHKQSKIAPVTVALPLLAGGGTMATLKMHPKTRYIGYKQLIGWSLVGSLAGLLTGAGIETLQNR